MVRPDGIVEVVFAVLGLDASTSNWVVVVVVSSADMVPLDGIVEVVFAVLGLDVSTLNWVIVVALSSSDMLPANGIVEVVFPVFGLDVLTSNWAKSTSTLKTRKVYKQICDTCCSIINI